MCIRDSNSSLPNKTDLLAQLAKASQPDPQAQQAQQQAQQVQLALVQAQASDFAASAQKKQAEAQQVMVETQLAPEEVKTKRVAALSTNLQAGNADDKEFERRAKIADLMLKEKSIKLKEQDMAQNAEIVKLQMAQKAPKQ